MTERTLDGWSIADHLAHIALWDDIRTQEVARISAGHASVWRMDGEQDAALNAVGLITPGTRAGAMGAHELTRPPARSDCRRHACGCSTPTATRSGLHVHEVQHAGWIEHWRAEKGL